MSLAITVVEKCPYKNVCRKKSIEKEPWKATVEKNNRQTGVKSVKNKTKKILLWKLYKKITNPLSKSRWGSLTESNWLSEQHLKT